MKKMPKSIIVRMPNWIGDAVMASPILADLRKKFPDSEITAMCQGAVGDLFRDDPHLDSIFRFNKVSRWIHQVTSHQIIDPLIKGEYDLGVLLTNSLSSAWWFYRGGVKTRLGFATHWRSFLLNEPVKVPKDIETTHLVEVYKELLKPLGIEKSDSSPTIYLTEAEKNSWNHILNPKDRERGVRWIGINPGAAFGSAKCWLPDRFRALIEKILIETPHTIVCVGDQMGKKLCEEITQGLGDRVINMAGRTTLRELLSLISQFDAFLTNDSGPMHIAAALKTPLVALFGSTNPIKTGPYKFGEVIWKQVFCSPCYKRTCPIDFQCMKKIEVNEVFNKLMHLIENGRH